MFVECVVAPGFTSGALEVLTAKKNIRLLALPDGEVGGSGQGSDGGRADGDAHTGAKSRFLARAAGHEGALSFRSVYGGVLFQSLPDPPFHGHEDPHWKVVTTRHPTKAEQADLSFAWSAVASVKSNAILLARNGATVGIGAGQTSRVDSSRLAVQRPARPAWRGARRLRPRLRRVLPVPRRRRRGRRGRSAGDHPAGRVDPRRRGGRGRGRARHCDGVHGTEAVPPLAGWARVAGSALECRTARNHLWRAWRGGRAVQCTGLENRRPKGHVGSNPTPSVELQRYEGMGFERCRAGSGRATRRARWRRLRSGEAARRPIPPPP